MDVYVGGATATLQDLADKIAGRLPLFIAMVVGLSVLLLMAVFRSLWVPLVSAAFNLLSIAAAYGVVVLVFQQGVGASLLGVDGEVPIVSFVPLFMFAILFGLSMDYNVFLQSRIREEYMQGAGPQQSVVRAMARVGRIILAAGRDHDERLPRLRDRPRRGRQDDRPRPGGGDPDRRPRRANGGGTGGDDAARRPRLDAARLARPRAPEDLAGGRPARRGTSSGADPRCCLEAGTVSRIEFPHFIYQLPFEAEAPHEKRQRGLLVLCAAMFISAVDMTIVNVALPDISEDLNAGVGELQWVLDGFLVALAGLLLVGSGLADRFGRKRIFLTGLTAFGVASVLCALAPSPAALIGARVLMGAAAACVLPPALSLIAVMFPPEERPQALGVWAGVAGVGLVLGPVLGGVLVREVGWEAVFLVNVPGGADGCAGRTGGVARFTRPGTPPIDLLGVALSIASLGCVVFTLIEGPDAGWESPAVLVTGAVGVLAGVGFVRTELRRRDPLFDVRVLARPAVAAGALAILSVYVAFLGTMFLLPQYLQYVQDRSVVEAGLVLAPLGLGAAVGARYNARVFAALGARLTLAGGLVLLAASTALFLLLGRTTTLALALVGTGLIGLLISLAVPPATAVIMNDLGDEKAGDGGAVNQLARQVGGALGVAIIGTVFAGVYANQIEDELGQLRNAERERAAESIEEARDVIDGVAGPLREVLLVRADDAFDVAARAGFGVCVGVLLAAAACAAIALAPKRITGTTQGEP